MVTTSTSGTSVSKSVEKSNGTLVVLISGRGSNLAAILRAIDEGRLRARVAAVISNRADAPGLAHARRAGVPAVVVPSRDFATRETFDRALGAEILRHGATIVCLAGFMRLLGPAYFEIVQAPTLNVHPSLLPSFPGTDAQRQALDHGVKISGVTVHFVTPELDAGPIVMQTAVDVIDSDTPETLADRILQAEHRVYPAAIQRVLDGGWRIDGRRVVFPAAVRAPVVE
jgi:phosphoribosylglycinamide formyltransferase-1